MFLVRAEAALGHPIEVISGREEARLIYAGVAFLQPSIKPRLVIDIGGRSTEMILGDGRTPRVAESFQVGCVSLSMRFFPDGRYTRAAFRAAQVAAGAELEEALVPFARRHWREALGSSGTAGAVADVLKASGKTDGRITAEGLRWLIERCIELGPHRQARHPRHEARTPRGHRRRAGDPLHDLRAIRHRRVDAGQGRAAPGRDRRPQPNGWPPATRRAATTCATRRSPSSSAASTRT